MKAFLTSFAIDFTDADGAPLGTAVAVLDPPEVLNVFSDIDAQSSVEASADFLAEKVASAFRSALQRSGSKPPSRLSITLRESE